MRPPSPRRAPVVRLDLFEGPLDLLLHLIKQNAFDILDIPVAEIARQYLGAIEGVESLDLDQAGDYLVMAATLMHLKSQMMLPRPPAPGGEEGDPRAELVRRLLEYQRFKEAARALEERPQLGRDVFARKFPPPELGELPQEPTQIRTTLSELVEAFRGILARLPKESVHAVELETVSVAEKMSVIEDRLRAAGGALEFTAIFRDVARRLEAIALFLALLELVRLKRVRVRQEQRLAPIWIARAEAPGETPEESSEKGVDSYR